jgi:pyruvate decarboxylase
LGEVGTADYGLRDVPLPPSTKLFMPITWHSIGFMLPAAQGAALAQRELVESLIDKDSKNRRTILLIGDGSFQMTAQELSTIIRHGLDVVVFPINNDKYTIERAIHGLEEEYNNVTPWRYLLAPQFFGARQESVKTASVRTWGELENTLTDKGISEGKGLRMIEIITDLEDCPTGPMSMWMEKEKNRISH